MERNLVPYSILSFTGIDGHNVGGKARGLAVLRKAGLKVPPGFIVVPSKKPADREELRHAYEALGGGPVAVRSSAGVEDGEDLSAAGQYESFLGVQGLGAVTDAIRRCFDSSMSGRVQTYREQFRDNDNTDMAVIVQSMVDTTKSGVIFTADPVQEHDEYMVIESVAGLGEDLVGGKKKGYSYRVHRKSGTVLPGQEESLLLEQELTQLIQQAGVAEKVFGKSLDMEWAIDSSGTLFWLQARPITTIHATSLDTPVDSNEFITRCNIGEMLPGAATPLTLSVFAEPLDWGLKEMTRKVGALKGCGEVPRFIIHIRNHLFMNLTSMFYIARNVAGASREALELNILGKVLPPYDIGPNAPGIRRFLNGIRYASLLFSHNRFLKRITRLGTGFTIETTGKTMKQLYEDLCTLQQTVLNETFYLHYCISAYSGAMNGILASLLSGGRNVSTEGQARMSMALTNIDGIESADLMAGIQRITAAITDMMNSAEFSRMDDAAAVSWLESDASGRAGELYRYFLKRHGHRCIREAELRSRDYETYPEELIGIVKNTLSLGISESEHTGSTEPETEPPPLREVPKGLLKRTKEGVRQRELSKSMLIRVQHQFKKGYRQLAKDMTDHGLLKDPDLVYFLTREEIGRLLQGTGSGRLNAKAEQRKKELPFQMELSFPETSRGVPKPIVEQPDGGDPEAVLKGTPVSKGIVEAPVRIVKTLEEAHKLQKGEIMVAPFTDVGWTPFFGRISGLVTEIGGSLSHGAVVAREYGLPMVSNIGGITNLLITGETIRLDGRSGTVRVIGKPGDSHTREGHCPSTM